MINAMQLIIFKMIIHIPQYFKQANEFKIHLITC